jgi:hypothetical protein
VSKFGVRDSLICRAEPTDEARAGAALMPYRHLGMRTIHEVRICKVSRYRGMGEGMNHLVALRGRARIYGSIAASTKTATVGQPLVLTWTASAGSICFAYSTSTNTAWIASKPPFTGAVPASGKQILTETMGGTVTYTLTCTAPGAQTVHVSTSVFWRRPPVAAPVSASRASTTAGEAVTVEVSLEP